MGTPVQYTNSDGINFTNVTALTPLPVTDYMSPGGLPVGATALTNSSGNKANASAVATLTGTATTTVYLTGFQITATGATAALAVTVTVAGVLGGTMSYSFAFPAGVAVAAQPLVIQFAQPIPASAVNTAIVVTLPASGTGGTNAAVSAQGYYV